MNTNFAGIPEAEINNGGTPEGKSTGTLSKNKLRKLKNYEKIVQNRLIRRKEQRTSRKDKEHKSKTRRRPHVEDKAKIIEKLTLAHENGPKVAIDCQFIHRMSDKEQRHLAQQLRRVYASNKIAASPLSLYCTSLDESSSFFDLCTQVNDGFARYLLQRSEKSFVEVFSSKLDQLVYLSPDSSTVLDRFDPTKVYVIGGLVDETVQSDVTVSYCRSKSISTARLPIKEYFKHGQSSGTFKTILTVNQIVDIILKWHECNDWVEALQVGLPNRTGFVPKTNVSSSSSSLASDKP